MNVLIERSTKLWERTFKGWLRSRGLYSNTFTPRKYTKMGEVLMAVSPFTVGEIILAYQKFVLKNLFEGTEREKILLRMSELAILSVYLRKN